MWHIIGFSFSRFVVPMVLEIPCFYVGGKMQEISVLKDNSDIGHQINVLFRLPTKCSSIEFMIKI